VLLEANKIHNFQDKALKENTNGVPWTLERGYIL
jgi:hypothetical protein